VEQVFTGQRHTPCRRREPVAGDMQEYSAAATSDAWPRILVDFDDEIVEAVGSQQPVAWFIGRPAEWPVVAPIGRVFTPGIVRPDAPHRKQGARPWQAVGAPPQPDRMKSTGRCRAIALSFRALNPRAAQGGANGAVPNDEPALRPPLRARPDMNCGKESLPHRPCRAVSFAGAARRKQLPQRSTRRALTFCRYLIFSGIVFPFPDHALVSLSVLIARGKSAPKRRASSI
jgi:hypothetical protein